MQCPGCKGERITATPIMLGDLASLDYKGWCLDCGKRWEEKKVVFPTITPEVEAHWANVEGPVARYAREFREIQRGLDKGECPKCGAPLVLRVVNPPEDPEYVHCNAVCRNCKWFYSSVVSFEDWAEKKKEAAGGL